ncbi:MAG: PepSY domain-containing protein [Candidatus Methylomirabilis oxyfera]|nr:PepSY domain-containing protein [Candidatus Methylomirabilis oxyfera]
MKNRSIATAPRPKPRPKNWLIIKFREWHIWLGVALSLFIVIVSVTGIYLNHEWSKLFKGESRNKPMAAAPHEPNPVTGGLLATSSDLTTHPLSFAQALARARELWGDVPIQHVHLNDEHGTLIYKIKGHEEDREIQLNASTGALTEKNGYKQNTQAHAGAEMKRGINWGKVMKDLHTGKVGGEAGTLLIDFTSVIIIALTLTGMYLWVVPKWRKRRAERIMVSTTPSRPERQGPASPKNC